MNTKQILHGVLGGLAGGLVFGMMMGMMGMLPMIGKMVGQPSAMVGFFVHMVNSAVIGVMFTFMFGRRATHTKSGLGYGMLYGMFWWFLGPLTLMPLFMGMGLGVNWNLTAMGAMLPSLMGHLMFGAILGVLFAMMEQRAALVTRTSAA